MKCINSAYGGVPTIPLNRAIINMLLNYMYILKGTPTVGIKREFPPRIIFIIRGIFKPKQTKRKVKPFKTKVQ